MHDRFVCILGDEGFRKCGIGGWGKWEFSNEWVIVRLNDWRIREFWDFGTLGLVVWGI